MKLVDLFQLIILLVYIYHHNKPIIHREVEFIILFISNISNKQFRINLIEVLREQIMNYDSSLTYIQNVSIIQENLKTWYMEHNNLYN